MFSLVVLFNIPAESGLSGASGRFELYPAVVTVTVLKLRSQLQQILPLFTYNIVQNILALRKTVEITIRSKGLAKHVCFKAL